jgi:TPR repeat protein
METAKSRVVLRVAALCLICASASITGSVAPAQPITQTAEQTALAKAEELLNRGDIAGARLMLEHLLPGGSAAVAFRLAETYDPRRLSAWRVVGMRGDPKRARELYERALAGGMNQAQERLAGLPR